MSKENNKVDINKHEIDIDTLFKQNVNDLSAIKELYRKLQDMENKILQIKYIDSNLANKLKKDYENLKKDYESLKKAISEDYESLKCIILDENVQAKLANDIEAINSHLDTKASKNEIFTMANMGQDVKEAMTGGSVAVVGRNTVIEENIVDGQIKPYKLDAYTNIIDKGKVEKDKIISTSTFEPVYYEGYSITNFIPVSIGDYIINYYSYDTIFIYDTNKNKIKYINTNTDSTIFNIEQNGYIRLVIPTNMLEKAMCIKGNVLPEKYIPYGTVDWLKLNNNNFSDKCVPNNSLNFDYEFIEKWKNEMEKVNLFNKNEVIEGKSISFPNGKLTDNADFFVSDYIKVSEGYYTLNIANYDTVFLYNNDKSLIDKIKLSGWGNITNTISIDSSVSYIRLSCLLTHKNEIMFVKGKKLPDYYLSYNSFSIPNLFTYKKSLKGIYLFSGDSICYGAGFNGGYATLIAKSNPDAVCINYGVSGTKIAKIEGQTDSILERIENMQDEADFIIFEGGVNDAWSSLIQLGDFNATAPITSNYINNLNEYTFSGGLESLFNKAQNKWHGKKIFFIIPHNMDLPSTKVYMDRAEEICKKWSVILIDLRKLSGLNTYNEYMKKTYTNESDGVHPNELGYKEFYIKPIIDILMKYN